MTPCDLCDDPVGIEHFVMVSDALQLGDTQVWEVRICAGCHDRIVDEISRVLGKDPALPDLETQADTSQ